MMRLSTIDRFGALPTPGAVLGHVRDARARWPRSADWSPTSRPVDRDPAGARPEPGDDLGELGLAVAGDRGDADDLAGADLERDALEGGQAAVVVGADVARPRARRDPAPPAACSSTSSTGRPTISRASSAAGDARAGRCPRRSPCPARMTVIRSAIARTSPSLWLMKTTLRPAATIARRVTNSSSASCGASTAVGSSMMRIARPAVEHLEDLDPLLLADGQLPDPGARIDVQPDVPRPAPATSASVRRRSSRNRGSCRPSSMFSVTVSEGTSVKC